MYRASLMKVYAGTAGSGYRNSNEKASFVSASISSHLIRRSMAIDIMSTISKVESMANNASHMSNTESSENSRPKRRRIQRLFVLADVGAKLDKAYKRNIWGTISSLTRCA
jgi:hypothetical protein